MGLFIAGPEKIVTAVRDVFESSIFIRTNADRLGGISPLTKRQQQFINEWEAEAFRKTLAAGKSEGALKQRIAVVTGAGSGLGRSIAIGLARAGANVGLADIDIVAAAETQQAIKAELPGASAVVLPCNVADEASVEAAFQHLMDSFGGLDILVNAAGIAPPYALVDLPVEKWRQALEVNLTGYFLMAKAAARIMIAQGLGGSIINLSSKSGLEASKNNTPYNATKAGEIHMARGWALELGEHGIRVNSVAPGNVFEGSDLEPGIHQGLRQKYGIKPGHPYPSQDRLRKEIKGRTSRTLSSSSAPPGPLHKRPDSSPMPARSWCGSGKQRYSNLARQAVANRAVRGNRPQRQAALRLLFAEQSTNTPRK